MPDATTATGKPALQIPVETAKQFPELVDLIKGSSSMDNEERQYWIDVLPIMSDDQIKNLKGILDNEKKQIEEANQSYAKGMGETTRKAVAIFDEAAYKEKKRARMETERISEQNEKAEEVAALKELGNI
jgi:hypothetical protein